MADKTKKVRYFGTAAPEGPASREAYASDASIYRILAERVLCPNSEKEAIAIITDSLNRGIPVTARGGGTGLAGGALGKGLIVDCSRLTDIQEISTDNRTVTCQPGIIYQDLNIALKGHGLFFPPDPSSGDSCQIGGMLANNSSGPRSIKYGLTSHYVEQLRVLTNRKKPVTLKKYRIDDQELKDFLAAYPEYEEIRKLLVDNSRLILDLWPKVKKNSAGYNLHQVVSDLDNGIFNIPALYIGSEGTLGLFLSVKLRLLPVPPGKRAFRLFFNSLEGAGDAVGPLLETEPSSLEIVDGSSLDLIGRQRHRIPSGVQAMLMLEYDDDLDAREEMLAAALHKFKPATPPERAATEEERLALWAARRAIVPTLYRHHPIRRPIPFIEDASLPVEKLTEFISWVRKRLEKEGLVFGLFGHIGDGNVHIRPLLNLARESEFELAKKLYDETYDKIFALGGSSTAEHADGRLRAPVLRKLYGDEIYNLFVRIKQILDPDNLFNPDVILSSRSMTDDIDLIKLELTCAACGKCNGYCPAFEVFRREDMSPRGWLRMLKFEGAENETLSAFYEYCLNCRSCTTICPAGVDIAGEILKYKALRPNKTAGRVISVFDNRKLFNRLLKSGSVFYPLSRTWLGRKMTVLAGRRSFGIDDRAVFPQPARKSLRERHSDLCINSGDVALFHGCADNYFVASAGDAVVNVFRHFGWGLAMPEQACCGLPMEVYGHRENLIEKAKFNIDALSDFTAVVFTCASCLHRLADYHQLFETGSEYHGEALALKDKLFDLCQYLRLRRATFKNPTRLKGLRVSYHHPCHLRAAGLENEPLRLLAQIEGIEILHPERAGRCCGQAGSFGYTHYREGTAMFDAKREEYRRLNPDVIVSSCPSCIAKIRKEMGDGVRVCHPIELIAEILEG
jgi:FAD/FMN-containing dehydrogenase/Fe-S oxidoreductase